MQEETDESIGNIRNLIDKKQKLENNQFDSIPIVTSKNQSIDETKKIPFQKVIESERPKNDSKHKILKDEVINWEKMTLDESAEILRNHICYHNEEGFLFINS